VGLEQGFQQVEILECQKTSVLKVH